MIRLIAKTLNRTLDAWIASIFVAIFVGYTFLGIRNAHDVAHDWGVYRSAIQLWRHGGNLYQYHASNGDPFTYPPFAAIFLEPSTLLAQREGYAIWTMLSVAVLAYVAQDIQRRVIPAGWMRAGRYSRWTGTLMVLGISAAFQSNLRFGQLSILVFALAYLDIVRLLDPRAEPRWFDGFGLGLSIGLKVTPALFLVFLLVVRLRRAAWRSTVVVTASVGCSAVLLPSATGQFWTKYLWDGGRVGKYSDPGNQSIRGVIARLLPESSLQAPLWAALSLVVLCLSVRAVAMLYRRGESVAAAVTAGSCGLAISPVSWTHHQLWLGVAAVLLLVSTRKLSVTFGVILAMVTTTSASAGATLPVIGPMLGNLRGLCIVAIAVGALRLCSQKPRLPAVRVDKLNDPVRAGVVRRH